MTIAVVCANIGGIDHVHGIPRQNMECDYYYYTESNLPFPLPNLNARMRSKYIKIMMHRFLPQYDAYVWLDGKVEVLQNNFVELMTANLPDNDICIFRHEYRQNPVEEIEFIEKGMRDGGKYLLSRYGEQSIEKEKDILHYRMSLYETTLFARWNKKECNEEFEKWWMLLTEYSCFDQALFSYISCGISVHQLSRSDFAQTFKIVKHK